MGGFLNVHYCVWGKFQLHVLYSFGNDNNESNFRNENAENVKLLGGIEIEYGCTACIILYTFKQRKQKVKAGIWVSSQEGNLKFKLLFWMQFLLWCFCCCCFVYYFFDVPMTT